MQLGTRRLRANHGIGFGLRRQLMQAGKKFIRMALEAAVMAVLAGLLTYC
jgi:hypothetical protein